MVVIIRNHIKIYAIVINLPQFLEIFWEDQVNPNPDQIKTMMGANNFNDEHSFTHALIHLEWNNYIQINITDNRNKVILRGENPFPNNYPYLRYCLEIPPIEL
ncbi:MAG: hypothetical protein ACFFCV_06995 [Promethearchaeota archaeon]